MQKLWSKREIELLKKLYPTTKRIELAKRLNRPIHAILFMAKRLGLEHIKGYFNWSPREVKLLKDLFPQYHVTIEDIANRLNRGIKAVRTKANQMGLRRGKRPK